MLIFHDYFSLLFTRSAFDAGHRGFSSLLAKILLKSWPLASSMLVYLAILASAAAFVDQTQNHLDFTNVPGIWTYWTTVFQGRKPWYSFWWVASLYWSLAHPFASWWILYLQKLLWSCGNLNLNPAAPTVKTEGVRGYETYYCPENLIDLGGSFQGAT